jgi:amyloid beta precursor protein binding protein 1
MKSKPFWILVRALKEFVENEGQGDLPLRGSIPDMFSDSERFIALQNVYRDKAQHDFEAMVTHVERLLHNIDKQYDYINENQIRLFCKNSYYLKLIRGRSLDMEYNPQTSNLSLVIGISAAQLILSPDFSISSILQKITAKVTSHFTYC